MEELLRVLDGKLAGLAPDRRAVVVASVRGIVAGLHELGAAGIAFGPKTTLKALGSLVLFLQSGRSFEEFLAKHRQKASSNGLSHVAALFSSV